MALNTSVLIVTSPSDPSYDAARAAWNTRVDQLPALVAAASSVQDVVDAVLYLESASFVTGEIIHVDGGYHAMGA